MQEHKLRPALCHYITDTRLTLQKIFQSVFQEDSVGDLTGAKCEQANGGEVR